MKWWIVWYPALACTNTMGLIQPEEKGFSGCEKHFVDYTSFRKTKTTRWNLALKIKTRNWPPIWPTRPATKSMNTHNGLSKKPRQPCWLRLKRISAANKWNSTHTGRQSPLFAGPLQYLQHRRTRRFVDDRTGHRRIRSDPRQAPGWKCWTTIP